MDLSSSGRSIHPEASYLPQLLFRGRRSGWMMRLLLYEARELCLCRVGAGVQVAHGKGDLLVDYIAASALSDVDYERVLTSSLAYHQ